MSAAWEHSQFRQKPKPAHPQRPQAEPADLFMTSWGGLTHRGAHSPSRSSQAAFSFTALRSYKLHFHTKMTDWFWSETCQKTSFNIWLIMLMGSWSSKTLQLPWYQTVPALPSHPGLLRAPEKANSSGYHPTDVRPGLNASRTHVFPRLAVTSGQAVLSWRPLRDKRRTFMSSPQTQTTAKTDK